MRTRTDGCSTRKRKSRSLRCGILIIIDECLALYRCSYRAVSGAGSAVDADALVDNIRCSLCNSLYRAVAGADSAADAVVSDLICHNITSLSNDYIYYG